MTRVLLPAIAPTGAPGSGAPAPVTEGKSDDDAGLLHETLAALWIQGDAHMKHC